MESSYFEVTKSVHDFRSCFSDSIIDIQNSIRFEIGNKLESNEFEADLKRITDIYLNIAHDAAIKYQITGNSLDQCLHNALNESEENDADLMLSLAIFYAVKSGYDYTLGKMDYALKSLMDANHYFGSYIGFCHFVSGDSDLKRKAAKLRHEKSPSLGQDAIEYYKKNKKSFSGKDEAADFISRKIVPLKCSYIRKLIQNV